jgi:hypothetical protein
MLTPDSYVRTAPSNNALNFLQELDNHFDGPSAKFEIEARNDDTGGSGDYGIVVSPVDSGETWQLALWYDAGAGADGRVKGWIDPQASISDPIDTASGSTEASGAHRLLDSDADYSETLQAEFLLAEFVDGIVVAQKLDTSSEDVPRVGAGGRGLAPIYSSDPGADLDGLWVCSMEPGAFGLAGAVRAGESDWVALEAAGPWLDSVGALPNGRVRPNPLVAEGDSTSQILGLSKWMYTWQNGKTVLARIEDTSGTGGLLVVANTSFGSSRVAIPWDPNTPPT